MKSKFNHSDEILNHFKLIIYNWNINKANKYYNNDMFCNNYCIDWDDKYGCLKQKSKCPFEHSQKMNLSNLIFGNSKQKPDYKMCQCLCLYLMYTKIYNDKNSQLFQYYGYLLYLTGISMQDYLKSEKYLLKSLNIDNNNGNAHNNYALLLNEKLNNYDKAEYHYKQSLKIDPIQFSPTLRTRQTISLVFRSFCPFYTTLSWSNSTAAGFSLSLKEP